MIYKIIVNIFAVIFGVIYGISGACSGSVDADQTKAKVQHIAPLTAEGEKEFLNRMSPPAQAHRAEFGLSK